jgi:hypothetical protein
MNNKIAAHELLERRKRGEPCLLSEIDRALFLTGDLRGTLGFSSERMEDALHETNQPHWETQSIDLVARYSRINGEEAWESLCG